VAGSEGGVRFSLVPVDGGRPFVVTLPITLVGRIEGCDFQLDDDSAADLHCVLACSDDLLLLRDLETGNTRLNGQRVRRAVLLPNDHLTIGNSGFRIRRAEGDAAQE
jgi:pSer/pThr/pTyr-binding forkhead associated (FHA) protein